MADDATELREAPGGAGGLRVELTGSLEERQKQRRMRSSPGRQRAWATRGWCAAGRHG